MQPQVEANINATGTNNAQKTAAARASETAQIQKLSPQREVSVMHDADEQQGSASRRLRVTKERVIARSMKEFLAREAAAKADAMISNVRHIYDKLDTTRDETTDLMALFEELERKVEKSRHGLEDAALLTTLNVLTSRKSRLKKLRAARILKVLRTDSGEVKKRPTRGPFMSNTAVSVPDGRTQGGTLPSLHSSRKSRVDGGIKKNGLDKVFPIEISEENERSSSVEEDTEVQQMMGWKPVMTTRRRIQQVAERLNLNLLDNASTMAGARASAKLVGSRPTATINTVYATNAEESLTKFALKVREDAMLTAALTIQTRYKHKSFREYFLSSSCMFYGAAAVIQAWWRVWLRFIKPLLARISLRRFRTENAIRIQCAFRHYAASRLVRGRRLLKFHLVTLEQKKETHDAFVWNDAAATLIQRRWRRHQVWKSIADRDVSCASTQLKNQCRSAGLRKKPSRLSIGRPSPGPAQTFGDDSQRESLWAPRMSESSVSSASLPLRLSFSKDGTSSEASPRSNLGSSTSTPMSPAFFHEQHNSERQLPLEKRFLPDEDSGRNSTMPHEGTRVPNSGRMPHEGTEHEARNPIAIPREGARRSVNESGRMVKKRLTAEDHVRESWLAKGLPVLSAEAKKKLRASLKTYHDG